MCEWVGPAVLLGVVWARDNRPVFSELLFPVCREPVDLKLDSVHLLIIHPRAKAAPWGWNRGREVYPCSKREKLQKPPFLPSFSFLSQG